jgi:hypothetical protein
MARTQQNRTKIKLQKIRKRERESDRQKDRQIDTESLIVLIFFSRHCRCCLLFWPKASQPASQTVV